MGGGWGGGFLCGMQVIKGGDTSTLRRIRGLETNCPCSMRQVCRGETMTHNQTARGSYASFVTLDSSVDQSSVSFSVKWKY